MKLILNILFCIRSNWFFLIICFYLSIFNLLLSIFFILYLVYSLSIFIVKTFFFFLNNIFEHRVRGRRRLEEASLRGCRASDFKSNFRNLLTGPRKNIDCLLLHIYLIGPAYIAPFFIRFPRYLCPACGTLLHSSPYIYILEYTSSTRKNIHVHRSSFLRQQCNTCEELGLL